MKDITKYINESLDNAIFEGFLDKLKNAIYKVTNNPKKYFKIVNDKLQYLKDKEDYNYFKKKDPEEVSKELDNLNNDKDLKDIYLYAKKDYKNLSYYENNEYNYMHFIKDIKEYFNCDDNKAYAIMQIALVIANEIKQEEKKKKEKEKSYYNYSNRSSGSNTAAFVGSAVAAAMVMHK